MLNFDSLFSISRSSSTRKTTIDYGFSDSDDEDNNSNETAVIISNATSSQQKKQALEKDVNQLQQSSAVNFESTSKSQTSSKSQSQTNTKSQFQTNTKSQSQTNSKSQSQTSSKSQTNTTTIQQKSQTNTTNSKSESNENCLPFPLGSACLARWNEDGLWYDAHVVAMEPNQIEGNQSFQRIDRISISKIVSS